MNRKGVTLVELILVLVVGGFILLSVQFFYRALASNTTDVKLTTEVQNQLRLGTARIKRELSNAGAGIPMYSTFTSFHPHSITFSYKDLLSRHCGSGSQRVTITYEAQGDSLVESVQCNGSLTSKKAVFIAPGSLNLEFKYLNEEGLEVAASDSVKMIDCVLEVTAQNGLTSRQKSRSSKSRIHLKNHLN